jgi:multicomponent Na+:H+ antiporter subunit G
VTRHIVATVLLGAGVALELLAVLGVAVMRDAFDRLHYVGVASFGTLLIAIAILVRQGFSLIADKSLAVGLLLTLLSPVLVHATARSFRTRERGDWRDGIEDHVDGDSR